MKLHVHVRSPYYLSVVVILIVVQQSETAGEKGGLFQRVDDSEIDERKENVRRQEEMRGLRQFVDRMEERSILDNGDSELSKTETPKTQIDKQKSDSGNIEEILDTIVALKQGFSEEKKATARLKRHVTRCNLSWITNVTFRENFQVAWHY